MTPDDARPDRDEIGAPPAEPPRPQRVDPMAPVDAMADRLLGPVRQQPDTLLGQIILSGVRRATVLSVVEVFGSADQRAASRRLLEQNRRRRG